MLENVAPEMAEPAPQFLPRDELTPPFLFHGVGFSFGRPLGCSDPSTPACSFERLLSYLYYLLLTVLLVLLYLVPTCRNYNENALSLLRDIHLSFLLYYFFA